RLRRYAAVAKRVAHAVAEVERTFAAVTTLARQAHRELARERSDRLAKVVEFVLRRVHEVDVFGKRLAQRARHRFGTAVGDEATTDLGLDLLTQLLDARLVLVVHEALFER